MEAIIIGMNEKKLELGVGFGNLVLKSTAEYKRISDDLFRNSFSSFIWRKQFLFYRKSYFVAFAVLCYFKTYLLKIYNFKGIKA